MRDLIELINSISIKGPFHAENCDSKLLKPLTSIYKGKALIPLIGSTKLVLARKGDPIVLKIPFNSYYDEDDDRSYPFECANLKWDGKGWDYCALEEQIYNIACTWNLGDYFAPISLASNQSFPIYIQSFVTVLTDLHPKCDSFHQQHANAICSNLNIYNFDYYWLDDFLRFNSKAKLKKLNKFIRLYSINDLRRANLGYYNGKPIILDYAGYREW